MTKSKESSKNRHVNVNTAAAAAKSLQSCPTSKRPHRRQPTRLPCPWDSPGKNTGVGCRFLLQCMKVESESEVVHSCLTLCDPMDCSPPGSPSMGFSRREYWSGLPLPSLKNMEMNLLKRYKIGQQPETIMNRQYPHLPTTDPGQSHTFISFKLA